MSRLWPAGFGRLLAWELLGFAPLIGLYLHLALRPAAYDPLQRTWLLAVQFPLLEIAAAVSAATLAFGLADGFKVGREGTRRLASGRERDLILALFALATVVVVPALAWGVLHDAAKTLGMAGVFLPRALELWRVREQSRPVVRALGFAAASGPVLIVALLLLAMLLGAAAPRVAIDEPPDVPLLIACYYVAVAVCSAWVHARAEPWRH